MKVVWTAESIERLKEIDSHIAQHSPERAARFIDLIFKRGESLAEFPQSGRKVPEYDLENLRELVEGNYRIIYQIKTDGIEIETVFESHRLLPDDPDRDEG
jgi:toxin ParE1/3/4